MSIVQIARAANVSYATAWRIINNQPGGSDEAIAAVRDAMGRLGYEPTNGKRRGRPPKPADGIRTRNIALLHFRRTSAISASILSTVQRTLAEQNLNLIFGHCQHVDALPQAVRSGNVDGILGYGEFPTDNVDPDLRKVPAVWMMTRTGRNGDVWGDRVQPDNNAIGQLAFEHLRERGHEKLAYLNPEAGFSVY